MKGEFDGDRIILTDETELSDRTKTKTFEVNCQGNITVTERLEFENTDFGDRRRSVTISRHELPEVLDAYHFATQDHGGCPHCGR